TARYSQPSHVGMSVMSAVHLTLGAGALKSRPTRSLDGLACRSCQVSPTRRRRWQPTSPAERISRATHLRPTGSPYSAQPGVHPRHPTGTPRPGMNPADPAGQFRVPARTLAGATLAPGVETAAAHTQHAAQQADVMVCLLRLDQPEPGHQVLR